MDNLYQPDEYSRSPLKADFYEVSGFDRKFTVSVFQAGFLIDEFEAVSEKQAHFLARRAYSEAKTPSQIHKEFMDDWHSKEGYAWRKKHGQGNA